MANPSLKNRFRGFLPVVVDIETSGLEPQTDALLEIAAVIITQDKTGQLLASSTYHEHIEPFIGARFDPVSMEINKIDPTHPFRFALSEAAALTQLFTPIQAALTRHHCHRAVLVGHNAWFDLLFLKAGVKRAALKKNMPFHSFTVFDTATLAGITLGQTVLSKALAACHITFDPNQAHSALYDAQKTAELFCYIVNRWPALTG